MNFNSNTSFKFTIAPKQLKVSKPTKNINTSSTKHFKVLPQAKPNNKFQQTRKKIQPKVST